MRPVVDNVSYYTLRPTTVSNPAEAGPAVRLMDVRIPDFVDGRKIVIRTEGMSVHYHHDRLWAEPLREGVAAALRAHLGGHGLDMRWESGAGVSDLSVVLERMDAFDDGTLRMEAAWILREEGGRLVSGRKDLTGWWSPGDLNSLAEQWSGLLEELATAIAGGAGTDSL